MIISILIDFYHHFLIELSLNWLIYPYTDWLITKLIDLSIYIDRFIPILIDLSLYIDWFIPILIDLSLHCLIDLPGEECGEEEAEHYSWYRVAEHKAEHWTDKDD